MIRIKIITILFLVLSFSSPVLAAGSSQRHTPITRINPMTYFGQAGTFISNCVAGTSCIANQACAGGTAFWVPQSHPLYTTIISTAMISLTTNKNITLVGDGTCHPNNSGYEIVGEVDLKP